MVATFCVLHILIGKLALGKHDWCCLITRFCLSASTQIEVSMNQICIAVTSRVSLKYTHKHSQTYRVHWPASISIIRPESYIYKFHIHISTWCEPCQLRTLIHIDLVLCTCESCAKVTLMITRGHTLHTIEPLCHHKPCMQPGLLWLTANQVGKVWPSW